MESLREIPDEVVCLVAACLESDPYCTANQIIEKYPHLERKDVHKIFHRFYHKEGKVKKLLPKDARVAFLKDACQRAQDYIDAIEASKPRLSSVSDDMSGQDESNKNIVPAKKVKVEISQEHIDLRESLADEVFLDVMKFLGISVINQFRYKAPKVFREKKWIDAKFWDELIQDHAMELPKFTVFRSVTLAKDGTIEMDDVDGKLEFSEEVNKKHFFKSMTIAFRDELVEKILEWTKGEPIYVDTLVLEIEEDERGLSCSKFLTGLSTIMSNHIIPNSLFIHDYVCPLQSPSVDFSLIRDGLELTRKNAIISTEMTTMSSNI